MYAQSEHTTITKAQLHTLLNNETRFLKALIVCTTLQWSLTFAQLPSIKVYFLGPPCRVGGGPADPPRCTGSRGDSHTRPGGRGTTEGVRLPEGRTPGYRGRDSTICCRYLRHWLHRNRDCITVSLNKVFQKKCIEPINLTFGWKWEPSLWAREEMIRLSR